MMAQFISQIQSLIGIPPVGCEWLEYLFVGLLLILLVDSAVSLVAAVFKLIGGR